MVNSGGRQRSGTAVCSGTVSLPSVFQEQGLKRLEFSESQQ